MALGNVILNHAQQPGSSQLGFFALGEFKDPLQMNTLDFLQKFHMSKGTVVSFLRF